MGAGASISRSIDIDDQQPVIKSAGGTPCRSPQSTSIKNNDGVLDGLTFFSDRSMSGKDEQLLFDALVEEMELKAKVAQQVASRIKSRAGE